MRIFGRWIKLAACALVMAWGVGCGEDAGTPTESSASDSAAATEVDAGPRVLSIRLDPPRPVSGELMRAQVRAVNPDGTRPHLTYQWMVRGRLLENDSPGIRLPKLRRGDRIDVAVVATQGERSSEAMTAQAVVANRPPQIRDLRLRSRAVGDEGEEWVAEVMGDDPDGDQLKIEYTWLVNDEPRLDVKSDSFPTHLLKRGDRLQLEVVASDGQDVSAPSRTGEISVANASPDILSQPPRLDGSGTYLYQVAASDPDGDKLLRYKLVEGPRGMKIDEHAGLLSWTPTVEQGGRHRVELAVEDGKDGRAVQAFELAIIIESESAPPASVR
jgi:hypothetical protein